MQLVAGVAGAVVGSFFGPAGAQIGFAIGSAAFGLFGPKPQGPGPGDLKRPQVTLGAQIPRVYGRVRRPVQPVWTSDFRATEVEQGGKGTPEGPSSYTYSLDILGWIADGDNVIAVTRIWVNNKLYYTALSDSDADSIAASEVTPQWDDFEFLPGTGAQVPWAVYEDAVGATDAPAYRGVASIGFENFQTGSTKQLPFIEVEVITVGTFISVPTVLATPVLPRAFNAGGSFPTGASSSGWFLDDTVSATATGSAWLAYWSFERDVSFPVESYTVTVTVEGLGPWSQVLNWADGEVTKTVAVQFNTPIAHTAITVGFDGDHFGEVYYGFYGTGGATVWESITPDVPFVESTDPAFGIVTDGAGNYRRIDVDYPTADIWGTNDTYTDNATPGVEDLADVVDAEMARVPGLDPSDWDSSDLVGVDVTGFTAIGPAAQSIGDLADTYHFDLVPGAPMRFVRRAAATVGSIAFNYTGAAAGEAGEPFTGLKIGNNDESPGVVGLSYPNIRQDHDVDFQSGDRLTTDGPDIRRVQTNVVLTPAEARGRAFSATVMQRAAAKTASFGISDAYAAAEPGDAYAVTDIDGNAYNLRIRRFSYADGVKQCDWELNDISALVDELDTETDYEEAITVAPAGTAEWLAWDGPKLRTEDDDAGYYAAVKTTGDEPAYFYESPDDATYSQVSTHSADAVFGAVTALAGTLRADGFFSENASITVDIGDGTLSSSTRAALLANRSLNAFAVGVQGRYVVGQFTTATLSAPGVYVLSGLLMGGKGTEADIGDVAVSDDFLLLNDALRRRPRSLAQLGVEFYVKAVAQRRAVASVTGEAFTNAGRSLTPLPPVQLRRTTDASTGDSTYTFNRQTRDDTRFGGDLGDACPLGEESELYRVRFYTDGTYATVVRDLGDITSPAFAYTGAQRTADYGSTTATAYARIVQVSAVVGEGHALDTTA